MIKIFKRLKPIDWVQAVINMALIVLMVFLELKIPDFMTEITQIIGDATKDHI